MILGIILIILWTMLAGLSLGISYLIDEELFYGADLDRTVIMFYILWWLYLPYTVYRKITGDTK